MRKEYTTLEEILEDAETGKISQSHLMDEGFRTCFACKNTEDKYGGKMLNIYQILTVLSWHFQKELVSKILLNKFNDINNKKKWVCATCKDEYMESM
tara:strand:- start:1729 stop:2019 length:291 start_codon:yes stop_codon:yes gene_type:complete